MNLHEIFMYTQPDTLFTLGGNGGIFENQIYTVEFSEFMN